MLCVVESGRVGGGYSGPTHGFWRRLRAKQLRAHIHTGGRMGASQAGGVRRTAATAGGGAGMAG
eukprot:4344434-Pleurochrysis_carterae.AAC.1